MAQTALTNSLWDYSLQLYQRPEIERLCLELQDTWGMNVNILLWLSWLEQQGLAIDETRLSLAQAHIDPWQQEVVQPLRQIRRHIKQSYGTGDPMVESSRKAVKKAELGAERVLQTRLQAMAMDWLQGSEANPVLEGTNLSVYARQLCLPDEKRLELIKQLQP